MTAGLMTLAPLVASPARNGPKGSFSTNLTVESSIASTSLTGPTVSAGPLAILSSRSKLNLTASASTGVPSANLRPSTSVKVHSRPSSLATQGIGRAHVCTPVTNAQLVCRLLLVQTKNSQTTKITH